MVLIHCSSHFAHETIPADVYEILIISCSKEGGAKLKAYPLMGLVGGCVGNTQMALLAKKD